MTLPGQRCWGVIPAAGIGSRMSADLPKQYLLLQGISVLEHSLKALLECSPIDSVMVALHPDDDRYAVMDCFADARVMRAAGGDTRADSVLAALQALSSLAAPRDWVLVHDAARPCVLPAQIMRLIGSVFASDVGGILAEPVVDTVKQASEDGRVLRTLERSHLWRAQTPQMFRFDLLRSALEDALAAGISITDEASAMEQAGHPVQLVPSSSRNLKITLPEDLQMADYFLRGAGSDL